MRSKAIAPLAGALLAACGGTGSMDVKLMDAPPDGVKAVKIWVAAVHAHVVDLDKAKEKGDKSDPADTSIDDMPVIETGADGADEPNKWISLTVNKEIDLVAAQGEGAANLLGQLQLPAGKITQLRLVVDTEKAGSNQVTLQDDSTCALDMAKVPRKGIKINHPFKAMQIHSGSKHEVYMDFDLGESMKVKGSCWEIEAKLNLHKFKMEGADVDTKV